MSVCETSYLNRPPRTPASADRRIKRFDGTYTDNVCAYANAPGALVSNYRCAEAAFGGNPYFYCAVDAPPQPAFPLGLEALAVQVDERIRQWADRRRLSRRDIRESLLHGGSSDGILDWLRESSHLAILTRLRL